jgi:hypothetical protein
VFTQTLGYSVKRAVNLVQLGAFFRARHDNVRSLQRWRLTRQRKHLVHSDAGSDRGIA